MGWRMSPSCFAGLGGHPQDDIIDPDTRCLFRAFTLPTQPICPRLLPRLRGAQMLTITVQHVLTAGPVPWLHGHATPCLPLPSSSPAPSPLPPPSVQRRMLRRTSSMCSSQTAVRFTYTSKHWSKPAMSKPGVSSAVATVQALRFSAMIIGPSRAEHH